MMNYCADCEFFCTGWCIARHKIVNGNYYFACANFTSRKRPGDRNSMSEIRVHTVPTHAGDYLISHLERMSMFPHPTYTDLVDSLDIRIKDAIDKAEMLLQEKQSATCFSCGSPLETITRGRSRYCARCGCYLPSIIYDIPHSFTDSVKLPQIMKPNRIPTTYSH